MVDRYSLLLGNCLETLKDIPDNSVDSVVTDPPYGISFMSKKWDYDVPSVEIWKECFRVLKPGGYLLSFAGTRTQHRMAINIEDAGFEIRDMIAWVYSSGFPKSHNVSCSIDKDAGHPNRGRAIPTASLYRPDDVNRENKLTSNKVGPYEPKTDEAKQWSGWGTALKPALEPITMARKPLEGTVSNNVLKYGTGAINIDATRVPMDADDFAKLSAGVEKIRERGGTMGNSWKNSSDLSGANPVNPLGRWAANIMHDGSQEVLDLFPDAKGGAWVQTDGARHFNNNGKPTSPRRLGSDPSTGSAARFFYCPKSNKKDRNEGLDESLPNHHPTVKPTELMRYLVRMVTQPEGTVLDPFMGSGTTGKAAMLEGFRFIGCELDEEYLAVAKTRIEHACTQVPG